MRVVSLLSMAFIALSLCACGDLLKSLRQESLEADGITAEERDREREQQIVEAEYKPKRLDGISANNNPTYNLSAKRAYNRTPANDEADTVADDSEPTVGRRYTRNDFVDTKPDENSLWNGQGQNNYFFAQNRKNELGDLVTVEIDRDLRRDIQYSLWLTLPPQQRKPKKKAADRGLASAGKPGDPAAAAAKANETAKSALDKGKDEAEEAAKTNMASTDDLLRMEVVEQLGNGVVKAIGQKKVVYRGQSRLVETTALLHSKDVDEGGRIKSSQFVDVNTQVIQ